MFDDDNMDDDKKRGEGMFTIRLIWPLLKFQRLLIIVHLFTLAFFLFVAGLIIQRMLFLWHLNLAYKKSVVNI